MSPFDRSSSASLPSSVTSRPCSDEPDEEAERKEWGRKDEGHEEQGSDGTSEIMRGLTLVFVVINFFQDDVTLALALTLALAYLLRDDVLHATANLLGLKWPEAEARAARLQRWDDLVHVVADHAEARVLCVLLDYSTQRELPAVGFRVGKPEVVSRRLVVWRVVMTNRCSGIE